MSRRQYCLGEVESGDAYALHVADGPRGASSASRGTRRCLPHSAVALRTSPSANPPGLLSHGVSSPTLALLVFSPYEDREHEDEHSHQQHRHREPSDYVLQR
jgi:hypothetical protein